MNINELKNWIMEHNVESRSIEGFWIALNNYMEDSPEEYESYFGACEKKSLVIEVQQVALMLGNYPECNQNHIISYVPIIYNGKTLGLYRLLFTLDGIIDDDYFTLD
ncbi:hypothetical protein [Paenibacillus sp. OSY-SE]|uniref:hypothetical protein n=1 Tax=Paenibacillus sp. OSY-SE TaxID=1196323 RepID=UPI000368CF34|nr:hypothetical protein [Paenibacillus sp. OSY-SE]